ncbi:hypothetical protein N8Q34_04755, partial [Enterobacter hormaechei subsp. hoffmannii]|nr:hypothetical protein [Enterobacter hormaechei subsp. hoffmannii]
FGFAENTDDLFVGKTLLHGDVLMWLMKTLLTSGCTNQRGAGQPTNENGDSPVKMPKFTKNFSLRMIVEPFRTLHISSPNSLKSELLRDSDNSS